MTVFSSRHLNTPNSAMIQGFFIFYNLRLRNHNVNM